MRIALLLSRSVVADADAIAVAQLYVPPLVERYTYEEVAVECGALLVGSEGKLCGVVERGGLPAQLRPDTACASRLVATT